MAHFSGDSTPVLALPDRNLVNVEHPGIVKNLEKAIDSLGGSSNIEKALNSRSQNNAIGMRVGAEDRFRSLNMSRSKNSSDMLLKITVPKRTGLKRKRGSLEPFLHGDSDDGTSELYCRDTKRVFQSIRDNHDSLRMELIGFIDQTHKFRGLPDFQFSLCSSRLANSLKKNILTFDYTTIRNLDIDVKTKGVQPNMDMIPPPGLSQLDIPFNYSYMPNPYAKAPNDETKEPEDVVNSVIDPELNETGTPHIQRTPSMTHLNLEAG